MESMHVLAMSVELRLPGCSSLKEKRAALKPIVEGIRHRHHVSVAETGHQDQWQRASVGVALVASGASRAEQWMDRIERFIWSRPDVEVVATERHWMEIDR